jgi:hypothetical protein
MDDPNQIEVPPSFVALFTTPGGHRLTEPMSHVRERYELCEDMAQMLTEQAGTLLFKTGGSERDVLASLRVALSGPESALGGNELAWVLTRLAELLGWAPPEAESA